MLLSCPDDMQCHVVVSIVIEVHRPDGTTYMTTIVSNPEEECGCIHGELRILRGSRRLSLDFKLRGAGRI